MSGIKNGGRSPSGTIYAKVSYRRFGTSDDWTELDMPGQDLDERGRRIIFREKYAEPTYLSLKILACDLPRFSGNCMENTIEPAIFFDPTPVGCANLPPLPGAFYFADVDGDGYARFAPEPDYLKACIIDPVACYWPCVIPPNPWPYLIMDFDGNGYGRGTNDYSILKTVISQEWPWSWTYAELIQLNDLPLLDRVSNTSGTLSSLVTSLNSNLGGIRAGMGIEYTIISDPNNCISLNGRNPHPDWNGPRDQYITVTGEGEKVFEISGGDGIAPVTAIVNPGCPGPSDVVIEACLPASSEIPEYNTFDTPYQFQDKQKERICADPITLQIQ